MKKAAGAARAGKRVGLRGTLTWSAVDAAMSVARNHHQLGDLSTRIAAAKDVAWDASESAAGGLAGAGATMAVGGCENCS
jgi:hypothetical protein